MNHRLGSLWLDQTTWSERTFGSPKVRGPIGSLRHLQKECAEAIANPGDVYEFADCLLLLIDAAHRAGHSLDALITAAENKHAANKHCRRWPAPQGDEPVEHIK